MAFSWCSIASVLCCLILPVQADVFAERHLGQKARSHSGGLPEDSVYAVENLDALEAQLQEPRVLSALAFPTPVPNHQSSMSDTRSVDVSRSQHNSMVTKGFYLSHPLLKGHLGVGHFSRANGVRVSDYRPDHTPGNVRVDNPALKDREKQVDLHEKQNQIHRLKAEEAQIQVEQDMSLSKAQMRHGKMLSKLHTISKKRIHSEQHRLKKQQSASKTTRKDLASWGRMKENYRARAVESVKERHAAKEAVNVANAQLAKVKKKQEQAHKEFLAARSEATKDVEAYQKVQTYLNTAVYREKVKEMEVNAAEKSVEKMRDIFDYEDHRIEDSFAARKAELHTRLLQAQALIDRENEIVMQVKQELKE